MPLQQSLNWRISAVFAFVPWTLAVWLDLRPSLHRFAVESYRIRVLFHWPFYRFIFYSVPNLTSLFRWYIFFEWKISAPISFSLAGIYFRHWYVKDKGIEFGHPVSSSPSALLYELRIQSTLTQMRQSVAAPLLNASRPSFFAAVVVKFHSTIKIIAHQTMLFMSYEWINTSTIYAIDICLRFTIVFDWILILLSIDDTVINAEPSQFQLPFTFIF